MNEKPIPFVGEEVLGQTRRRANATSPKLSAEPLGDARRDGVGAELVAPATTVLESPRRKQAPPRRSPPRISSPFAVHLLNGGPNPMISAHALSELLPIRHHGGHAPTGVQSHLLS